MIHEVRRNPRPISVIINLNLTWLLFFYHQILNTKQLTCQHHTSSLFLLWIIVEHKRVWQRHHCWFHGPLLKLWSHLNQKSKSSCVFFQPTHQYEESRSHITSHGLVQWPIQCGKSVHVCKIIWKEDISGRASLFVSSAWAHIRGKHL